MKVTLNIENDLELRNHIKDAIRGQISSIVREEFYQIMKAEIEKKIRNHNDNTLEYYLKEAMTKCANQAIREANLTATINRDFIIPIVEKKVLQSLEAKNWDKLVDEMAKEKVKSLLK